MKTCMFSSVLRALGDLIISAGIMELTHAVDKAMLLMFISFNFRLLELILQLLIIGVFMPRFSYVFYPNDHY
jgi:hypothetical protein